MRSYAVRGLAVFAITVGALVALHFVWPQASVIQCDGSVPISFIPKDYNGSGCVPVPDDWVTGDSAEKYADERWVCLGMCDGGPYWDSATGQWVDTAP